MPNEVGWRWLVININVYSFVFIVTRPVWYVLHGHIHVGAVPEAGDVRPHSTPGCLSPFRVQRTRHARRLRIACVYELQVSIFKLKPLPLTFQLPFSIKDLEANMRGSAKRVKTM